MPVEAAGVRQARHVSGQRHLAQPQLGVVPSTALEPSLHLWPGGGTNLRIMERRRVAFEDGAFAARVPDLDLRAILLGAPRVSGQHQFGVQPIELEGEDLTKARKAVALQHDISADLQLQAVQRGLEREPPPVHRGGERKDRRFEVPPRRAETLQLSAETGLHGRRRIVTNILRHRGLLSPSITTKGRFSSRS